MLYRQKNGNPVYVAIPEPAAEAVLALPPLSESYFFWSGKRRPETAVRGWRRSLEHVYRAADLKRNGKKLRVHTHMLRHTFAIEKLKQPTESFPFTTYSLCYQLGPPDRHTKPIVRTSCQRFSPMNF